MSNKNSCQGLLLIVFLLPVMQNANADSLREANRLLRVAGVQNQFESATENQTRAIIRTYSSIVSMSVAVDLPTQVTQRISNCYAEVYAWKNFKQGLAQILAENLTNRELVLLIDFYRNLGLPPTEIQSFKQLITKADEIQRVSMDFMVANSASCVEQDAEIILDYVASQQSLQQAAFAN